MQTYLLFFVFLYGLIFGSFYNVVIYRMPNDMSISKGRSMCTSCKNSLKAIDLIPVVSYIFLGGKCRYCGEKISIRYPFIELLTGLLFSLAFYLFGQTVYSVLVIVFWSYLLIVTMIDIDHKVILDNISLFFFIIFLVLKIYLEQKAVLYSLLAGLICFLVYFLIYKLSYMYYKREAFGLGDVFYIAVVGFCLGFKVTYLTIFFPFIVAFSIIAVLFLIGKIFNIKEELPFAPFISISSFILTIYGEQMMNLILLK